MTNLKCLRINSIGSQDENQEYDSDSDENDILSIGSDGNFSSDENIIREGEESVSGDEDLLEGIDIQNDIE